MVLIPLVAISCCGSCSFPGLMECKTGALGPLVSQLHRSGMTAPLLAGLVTGAPIG